MQGLGLSDSTPPTESRWRALFWPAIRNEADLEVVTQQGFGVCVVVAVVTLGVAVFTGSVWLGGFEALYFFLAGAGVRQRSRAAGILAFASYFLSGLVMQRYTGNGFGVTRVLFLALLLAVVRGTWLSRKWEPEAVTVEPAYAVQPSLWDRISDRLPAVLWPKGRYVFYGLAVIEVSILILSLFAPVEPSR